MYNKLDALGRVVIPIHLRRRLNLQHNDPIDFCLFGDTILLKKIMPSCIFCGQDTELISYENRQVCKQCLQTLLKQL